MSYDSVRKQWLDDPEAFWADAARAIDWIEPASEILDRSAPSGRWFRDGVLNTCYNALDRHADSDAANRTALIYDSAMTGNVLAGSAIPSFVTRWRNWPARYRPPDSGAAIVR